jgi:Zn-dependent protease/predicted transcriptional regulator
MRWSWRICTVAGIGIYVHVTFFLLLLWAGWQFYHWGEDRTTDARREAAVAGIVLILAVFACVVLHELGHALTARRFGIRTRDITLLPIGGLARLERMPDDPTQELLVALAGPAVNVVIAIILFPVLLFVDGSILFDMTPRLSAEWLVAYLLSINVVLVLFNLLPAFPMDGGRVLRALLALRLDYLTATRIAAGIGQGMAFLFFALGLLSNPVLVIIAVFVFLGAAQEASGAEMHAALNGIPVRHAMLTDYLTLSVNERVGTAAAHLLEGSQQDFPVVDDGKVVGVLLRRDLLAGLSKDGPDGLVKDVMQTEFGTVDDREMLEVVFQRMQACGCHAVPVVRNGQLIGMVTLDNIGEFMMVQTALRKSTGTATNDQDP